MTTATQTPGPLSSKDHEVLAYIEQVYLSTGGVPSKDKVVEDGITNGPHFSKCLASANFRHALLARGIPIREYTDDTKPEWVLTEEQLVTANAMLDLRDNRSQSKKLRELGVTTTKWEGWLRDPAFQGYIRQRAENLLGDSLHESHLALIDRVRSGDINAIKYFNEITGRYVPNANDKADVNAILMLVLESIQRHVKDPEAAKAVAADLLAISTRQPTSQIINGTVLVGSSASQTKPQSELVRM